MSNGTKTTLYSLPPSHRKNALLIKIKKFPTIKEQATVVQQSFYDSFDWRLYNKKQMLCLEDKTLSLNAITTEKKIASTSLDLIPKNIFWWDVPDSDLKVHLKKCMDVRALLPLVQIQIKSQTIRLLNKDDKTVLFLIFEDFFYQRKMLCRRLKLQPVKGYDIELEKFRRFLDSLQLKPEIQNPFCIALESINKQPGDYSSKIKILLEPDWPAQVAMKRIFSYLLNVMQSNEAGIFADLDTEFLHDFRVSIRRTRSALTQIKAIFPSVEMHRYRRDFARLAKSTNRMRDLDVYLLKRDKYLSMLPTELASNLEPMFDVLKRHRIKEHQKVVKTLNTYWYKNIITSWGDFLDSPNTEKNKETVNSEKPIIDVAKKAIWKKYNKILKAGLSITKDSPDEKLHDLRIECKKLRYLLEFFTSLFSKKEMKKLVKQLQELQDNLGEFNDLYVQQISLQSFINSELKYAKYRKTQLAIGGLIALLRQKQQNVRLNFDETFLHFSSKQNTHLYRTLFK